MNWFSCRHLFLKVLDKAEYLRDMEANLLPGFLRLQELVSNIWECFSLSRSEAMFPTQCVVLSYFSVMIEVQSFPIVILIYDLIDLLNYFSFNYKVICYQRISSV